MTLNIDIVGEIASMTPHQSFWRITPVHK